MTKLDHVRATLAREITGNGGRVPHLQLSGGRCAADQARHRARSATFPFSFSTPAITSPRPMRIATASRSEWNLNLINLLPEKTVAEQEAEHGLLYQSAPDQCCKLRKVEPLFKAVANYRVWLTGLRREQAKSRAALEESALFTLPGGKQVLKLAPLAAWTTRDVWYACEQLSIPLLPLYERGYSSIGCEPCTSLPTRSQRSALGPLGRPQGRMRHSH